MNERKIHEALTDRGDEINLDEVIATLADLKARGHVRSRPSPLECDAGIDWYLAQVGKAYLGRRGMLDEPSASVVRRN